MTTETTERARFALDEDKAAEWLASRDDIGEDWTPVRDEEGSDIACLISEAQSQFTPGPLQVADGSEIAYDYTPDSDGGGYRWLVYLPGDLILASAFTGAPHYAGGLPLTDNGWSTTVTGPDAALAVLREAVAAGNAVLDELAAYVTAQAPDTLGKLWDAASDYEADTIREVARKAGVLWQCQAYPGGNFCGYDNREDESDCGGCGTLRKTCDCGEAWADEPGHAHPRATRANFCGWGS